MSKTYADPLMSFEFGQKQETVQLEDVVDVKDAVWAGQVYQDAIETYNKAHEMEKKGQKGKSQKEFQKALEGFQKIIEGGHDGPDLHNDIAITYYHLGEYEKCVEESRKVLQMGDENLYSAANFNAARAYEKLGNVDRAIANYQAGIKNGGNEKTFQKAIDSLRRSQQILPQGRGGK